MCGTYPATSGNTQGDRNETRPVPRATGVLMPERLVMRASTRRRHRVRKVTNAVERELVSRPPLEGGARAVKYVQLQCALRIIRSAAPLAPCRIGVQ